MRLKLINSYTSMTFKMKMNIKIICAQMKNLDPEDGGRQF
jgi:hypothetical protein